MPNLVKRILKRLSVAEGRGPSPAKAPWDIAAQPVRSPDASMQATRRELALFASEMMGVQTHIGQFARKGTARAASIAQRQFRDEIEQAGLPHMIIDPRAGLHIVDINDAYARATLTLRSRVAGGKLFDVFPDNPGDPAASGISNLYESLQRAAQTRQPHSMMIQRYDVRGADGGFVQRYWLPVNTPVFDESGQLVYLLHHVAGVSPDHAGARALQAGFRRDRI